MVTSQFLKLGNPRKVKNQLDGVLDQDALDRIENEIQEHSKKLYTLSIQHYRFAVLQDNRNWRQKVSRLYYAAYAASRCLRLYVDGYHSEEVSDHKKIADLPKGFPRASYFGNKLSILREDRNTCDYDHTSLANSLIIKHSDAAKFVREFLDETRQYLLNKGLEVRGKP